MIGKAIAFISGCSWEKAFLGLCKLCASQNRTTNRTEEYGGIATETKQWPEEKQWPEVKTVARRMPATERPASNR